MFGIKVITEKAEAKKQAKKEAAEQYVALMQAFRKDNPASKGWRVSVKIDKESDLYIGEIIKGNEVFAIASIVKGEMSHVEAEREAIAEAIIRFGVDVVFSTGDTTTETDQGTTNDKDAA